MNYVIHLTKEICNSFVLHDINSIHLLFNYFIHNKMKYNTKNHDFERFLHGN